MKIERKELHNALKAAKPALADKNPMTQLLCLWFSGESLYAYNNVIGIDVPLKTDFKGGIQGSTLFGLVSNSLAKFAEVSVDKSDFILKLGTAKARLPSLSIDQAVWEFPSLPSTYVEITDKLLSAVKHVMMSASEETGVSFISEKDRMCLYSTNDRTLSWSTINQTVMKKGRFEVPPAFCDQLIAQCRAGGRLYLDDDSIMATAEKDGGVGIFSRLIHSEQPLDYDKALSSALPENYHKKTIEAPGKLVMAIERALVLSNGQVLGVKHSVANEELLLSLDTNAGELRERIPLEGVKFTAEAAFDVSLIKKGMGSMERMLITNDCFILTSGTHSGYLVSAMA